MLVNICALWSLFLKGAPITNLLNVTVDFRIFHPNNPVSTEFNLNSVNTITFDETKKYVLLAHGWIDGFSIDWYNKTTTEFSAHEDIIVIEIGYEEAMNCKFYFGSVLLLDELAGQISKLLLHMRSKDVPLANIQFVGHSLGAHIAGITGKNVFVETGHKIKRIFALDPAAPLISSNEKHRLTRNDAERVIVIHSSKLGIQTAMGHVDFYPNGGTSQGQCGKKYISDHLVSAMYFFCSINEDCLNVGYQCTNYEMFSAQKCSRNTQALMGYHVDDHAEGSYYLNVNCNNETN